MHTRRCVRIVLRRIGGNMKKKAVSKEKRGKAEEMLTELKIVQIGCID